MMYLRAGLTWRWDRELRPSRYSQDIVGEPVVSQHLPGFCAQGPVFGDRNNRDHALRNVADVCTLGSFMEIRTSVGARPESLRIRNEESLAVVRHGHTRREPSGGNVAFRLSAARVEDCHGIDACKGHVQPALDEDGRHTNGKQSAQTATRI